MATNFPSSLDILTNPTPTTSMSGSLSHAGQHSDLNDAVEALQAKVGADSSGVVSSHDYKIAQLEAGATGGKILQVVTNTYATTVATTSTTYIDSGLTATITPTSATSKILVHTFGRYGAFRMGVPLGVGLRLVRDATTLDTWKDITYTDMGGIGLAVLVDSHSIVYEDSPATTSAITYKVQFNAVSSATAYANDQNTTSVMVLMEVSA